MYRFLTTTILAGCLAFGGITLISTQIYADCSKSQAAEDEKPECEKCKKEGNKDCGCPNHKLCEKCKKAGKKECDCQKKKEGEQK